MPNYTTNYNLEKPLQDEFYDVDVQNANMDKIDTVLNENAEAANDHITNKNNPHNVTKNQIGLGNVNNTSDANKPVSTAQATAIADAKKAATDHIANKNNPHDVTASQVGAAPTAHASSATTYGIGTSSNYGHVKLSDSVSSTSAASAGVAASPKAVKSAYDLANAALPKAGGTVTGEINVEMNAPALELNDLDSGGKTRILKNAGSDADYGTYITDFKADGTRDTLILNRSANKEQKLQLRIQNDDGTDKMYEIYGEHHPEVNTLYSINSVSFARNVDTSFLGLMGGNDASSGAVVELCGKNHSSLKGYFRIHAKDGTNSKYLEGKPDGTLTWGGKKVTTEEDFRTINYSSKVTLTISDTHTMVSDGYIYIRVTCTTNTTGYVNLTINGVTAPGVQANDYSTDSIYIPVKKGDVVKFTSGGSNSATIILSFYKLREV